MEIHCLAFACLTVYTSCTPLRNAWWLLYWNQLHRYSCVNTGEYNHGTWFSQRITTFVSTWKYVSDTEIFIRSNVPTSKLRSLETCCNTEWSKSIWAYDDYNAEVMCTETFWSSCIYVPAVSKSKELVDPQTSGGSWQGHRVLCWTLVEDDSVSTGM